MKKEKQQFHETTKQYFLNATENSTQTTYSTTKPLIKKFYIKEGPFINTTNIDAK